MTAIWVEIIIIRVRVNKLTLDKDYSKLAVTLARSLAFKMYFKTMKMKTDRN